MTFYIEEKKICYKQTLYKQGDLSDGVYLVKEGEFEITKKSNANKSQLRFLKSHVNDHDLNKLKEFRISIVSKNQIIGHQEWIDGVRRETTVKCINNPATVYFIPKNEFLERFKLANSQSALEEEKENKCKLIHLRETTLKNVKSKLDKDIAEIQAATKDSKFVILKGKMEKLLDKGVPAGKYRISPS